MNHERTIRIIGEDSLEKLHNSRIAVFGVGGVGGGVIEALARVGVGSIDVIDGDELTESNLNRQFLATVDTIGQRKVTAAKDRISAINPNCVVNALDMFVTLDNINDIDFTLKKYNYVIDAIDNVTAKLAIIKVCRDVNIPVISSMGTGNKLDATRFRITDISETSVCPLARVMRRELKNRGIEGVNVLWSDEKPTQYKGNAESYVESVLPAQSSVPGSISFVPPVAGMLIAGYVVKDLIYEKT